MVSFRLFRRGRGLDEEAAFEKGLENVDEMVALFSEAFFETLFHLLEGVVQIGANERVGSSSDDCDQEAIAALACKGDTTFGKIKGVADFSVGSFELIHEASDVVANLLGIGVTRWLVAGVADEGKGIVTHEEDFLDLVTMGAFEDDVVVSLARKECFHPPRESVSSADGTKVVSGLHLLRDGTTNGAAEHGLEISVESGFWRVEGFFE